MTTSHSDPHSPQDPLEDCLKHARWPQPTGLQRNRLEAQWSRLALERSRSRKRFFRWAMAASMFLAVGLGLAGWTLWNADDVQVVPRDPHISPPRMAEKPVVPQKQKTPPESLVRSATRYEKLVFAMAARQQRQAQVNRQPQPLVHALNRLFEEPDADAQKLCEPMQSQRAAYADLLLRHLGSWDENRQRAALKVLAEIGSYRAIPVLDRLGRDPEFAKRAWPVALRLAPARLLGNWARTVPVLKRKDVLQTLLQKQDDPQSLPEFLHLVAQPASRELALQTIKQEPKPPVEALFAFLKQGSKEQRHTAGLVLGTIATPDITRQLLALARQYGFPPEVMTGLLNSSDQEAARFVAIVRQNPQTQSAVRLAYYEWHWVSYTSSLPQPSEIY